MELFGVHISVFQYFQDVVGEFRHGKFRDGRAKTSDRLHTFLYCQGARILVLFKDPSSWMKNQTNMRQINRRKIY